MRFPAGFLGDIDAAFSRDQAVGGVCEQPQLQMDHCGDRVGGEGGVLDEQRPGDVEDEVEAVGILPGDEIVPAGTLHHLEQGFGWFVADILVGRVAQSTGFGEPDRFVDQSRIVDGEAGEDVFDSVSESQFGRDGGERGQ